MLQPHPYGNRAMSSEQFCVEPRFLLHESGFNANQSDNVRGVDYVMRFEHIDEEWRRLLMMLSIPDKPLKRIWKAKRKVRIREGR